MFHLPGVSLLHDYSSSLSIVDTSVFQMKPISGFFLLTVFLINTVGYETFFTKPHFCHSLCSKATYSCKESWNQKYPDRVCASEKPSSSFAYRVFQIFHVHKLPGSLLSSSEGSSHRCPVWKWKTTAPLTPLCFLVMLHPSLSEARDYFHSSPLAATVAVRTTLYNVSFPQDVALKGCDPRQNMSSHE